MNSTITKEPQSTAENIILCPACDLKLHRPPLNNKQYATCPRCHSPLYRHNNATAQTQVALCISALILLFVALNFPLLEMDMYGIYGAANIFQGVQVLFEHEFYFVSLLVFVCAIAAPMAFLSSILFINLSILFQSQHTSIKLALSLAEKCKHASMLEVYLVAFLISVFKLNTMAELSYGPGIIAFVGLVIINSFIVANIDLHCYWERLDARSS